MGQALYRKYRSRSLADVVGQDHITSTLEKAIKQGRISHAYLFTGPRGVGKTSVARILAHQINNLEYDDDSADIDIIEIDAASNRRIDEIRELREKVYVAPSSAKFKVYIIDEVHMLTREAFNALLKTLEEPPAHVVFILATTDAHKLPETIISRTQRFSFKPAETSGTIGLLRKISKAEKYQISDEALELISKHSGGSYRDSVSLLDQAASQGGKIEASDVQRLLGLPPDLAINDLIDLLISGVSSAEIMQALTKLFDHGYQAAAISQRLGKAVRDKLLDQPASNQDLIDLLDRLVEVPTSFDPERALEIALLRSTVNNQPPTTPEVIVAAAEPVATVATAELEQLPPQKPEPIQPKVAKKASVATALNADVWPEVLKALKQKYNTLYGVIRMAQPDFSDETKLKLAFGFSFHQKRIIETSNRQKLIDTIYEVTGQTMEIECIVDKSSTPPKISVEVDNIEVPLAENEAKPAPTEDISNISNIFGNAELLES